MKKHPPEPIERQMQANLIRLAEWWRAQTGYTLMTLSVKAHSDPRFFDALVERYKAGQARVLRGL